MDTTWEVEQAHQVGREIQRLRKAAGLTAQELGDRAGELGLKMTRQAISDLENGRRRYITTAELTVIAYALNTSPAALIYLPSLADGRIELLPDTYVTAAQGLQWFGGAGPDLAADPPAYTDHNEPLALSRSRDELRATAAVYAESDVPDEKKSEWLQSLVVARSVIAGRMRVRRMNIDGDT